MGGFTLCRRGDQGNKERSDSCRAVPLMETQGPTVSGHYVRKRGSRAACMCPSHSWPHGNVTLVSPDGMELWWVKNEARLAPVPSPLLSPLLQASLPGLRPQSPWLSTVPEFLRLPYQVLLGQTPFHQRTWILSALAQKPLLLSIFRPTCPSICREDVLSSHGLPVLISTSDIFFIMDFTHSF